MKENIRTAGSSDKKGADNVAVTLSKKIEILALHRAGWPTKHISGKTGVPMDWVAIMADVFSSDREFCAMADDLKIPPRSQGGQGG